MRVFENRSSAGDLQRITEIMRGTLGEDALSWITGNHRAAESMLNEWDGTWGNGVESLSVGLLLHKFNDYRMMELIRIVDQDPRFSLEAWERANPEDQKIILQEYMATLMPIFGVNVDPVIEFFTELPNDDGLITLGRYRHTVGAGTVRVNDWILENWDAERSYDAAFNTIRHELRHAYQDWAVDKPENFPVLQNIHDVWKSNMERHGGHYIFEGNERESGAGVYTYEEYRNQPREVDAFAFGRMRIWEEYV